MDVNIKTHDGNPSLRNAKRMEALALTGLRLAAGLLAVICFLGFFRLAYIAFVQHPEIPEPTLRFWGFFVATFVCAAAFSASYFFASRKETRASTFAFFLGLLLTTARTGLSALVMTG